MRFHVAVLHGVNHRAPAPVSRWGAMASRTEVVPTPGYHRRPMPAPKRRRPAIKEAPVEQRPGESLIWTDGACSGNPGPGGWAAIVVPADGGEAIELSGGEPDTT